MIVNWQQLAALAGAGVCAGTINTIAGGGSLITIPALIFAGLPANVANATNRVGVLFQSVTGALKLSRADRLEWSMSVRALIPNVIGAIVGALLSVDIDEAVFRDIIALALLVMLVVVLVTPRRWLVDREPQAAVRWSIWRYLGLFFIGVYGGFLQAGVGIFLLMGMVLLAGQDLVRANASKLVIVAVYTIPTLAIYVCTDLIAWAPGLALALGSTAGGWLGARLTISWGPGFIRWVLVVVILASSGRLLGVL